MKKKRWTIEVGIPVRNDSDGKWWRILVVGDNNSSKIAALPIPMLDENDSSLLAFARQLREMAEQANKNNELTESLKEL